MQIMLAYDFKCKFKSSVADMIQISQAKIAAAPVYFCMSIWLFLQSDFLSFSNS